MTEATTTIIDGKQVAADLRERIRREVAAFRDEHGFAPGLATVLVGDDPASHVYVGHKRKDCAEVGMESIHTELPAGVSQDEVAETLRRLNADERVHGIILQLPLPEGLDADELIPLIDADKDVDGLTPLSAGRLVQGRRGMVPCTPAGVMELLRHAGAELRGAEAVVVGRSNLVGKPLAQLLLAEHATVTICHSRTRDLGEVCRRADVLVAAVGVPRLVTADMVKEGAIVIDVGINRVGDKLVGDVDFDAVAPRARAITPVPGGVGPMTRAMLLQNTLEAARLQVAAR
jgi:methylenetetrahydrofolate dehydrogenase (NADP+)/methenyltetrahydrofolate cyclohydrolase